MTGLIGRRSTFGLFLVLSAASTAITFWFLRTKEDLFWMIPVMGFCQIALFGGYAIYLPELFPTKYRSTGTSFCYNAGRLLAAAGPFTFGMLIREAFGGYGADAIRYAGVTMCSIFLIGLLGAAVPARNQRQAVAGVNNSMIVPEWLTLRDGGLAKGLNDRTWIVTLDHQPLYRLEAVPAKGQFSCVVVQTNNGKRLDGGKTYSSKEAALAGGLAELPRCWDGELMRAVLLACRSLHQILRQRHSQVLVGSQLDVVDLVQPAPGLQFLAERVELAQVTVAHADRVGQ